MVGFILRIIRSVVNNVIGQITSQVNAIQDAVTAPLRGQVQLVTNGIWKGDGATRFVDEMESEVIKDLVNIGSLNMGFGNGIRKALDLMDIADRQAASKANDLVNIFSKIFS